MKRFVLRFSPVLILSLLIGLACSKQEKPAAETAKTSSQEVVASTGKIVFQVPEGWQKHQPRSQMRLAEFMLPGVDGAESAVLAVFFFPGSGGSLEDNLNRWYGQFVQPDGSPTEKHVQRKELSVNGMKVTVVYVTGTFLKSRAMMTDVHGEELPDYAMLAAIAEAPNGPWFFKAVGPQKTIDRWKSAFMEFVKSFKFES